MTWPVVRLEEVAASVDYGLTASSTLEPIGPKFLRITDIQDGSVDWNTVPYCSASTKEEAGNQLSPGDIVFARTGATTGKSFLIKECPARAVFASYLIRVRPNNRIKPEFLSRFFETPDYWRQITQNARGAAQPGVNSTVLRSLQIPLPSIQEQRQIAKTLDQTDSLRCSRRASLKKIDLLKKVAFTASFGDPATNDKKWPLGLISDIIEETQYGTSLPADETSSLPVMRMGNITYSGEIDLTDLKFIDLPDKDIDKHTIRNGDILFNRTNSPDLVGKTAIYKGEKPLAYAGYLVRVRCDERKSHPEYISGFLNSAYGKATLRGMCKTIIGMANINARELASIRIPIPPLDLQRAFAARVAEIDKLKALHRAHLAKLDELFAALQHRAFRGEL